MDLLGLLISDSLFCVVVSQAAAFDVAFCYGSCDPRHTLASAKGTAVALLSLCSDQFYHVTNVLGKGVISSHPEIPPLSYIADAHAHICVHM